MSLVVRYLIFLIPLSRTDDKIQPPYITSHHDKDWGHLPYGSSLESIV
jgi:hypothetical protein